MSVVEIREPSEFLRSFAKRVWIPAPVELTRVKLKHTDKNNHYLYIISFGYGKEVYFHDDATDFSGTGGRYKAEMDAIFNVLSERFNVTIKEMEMGFELYWRLKNMFFHYYKEYFAKAEAI
jgi:hypothetical protein